MNKSSNSTSFEESGDFPGVSTAAEDYNHVPGWPSLEIFLRKEQGIKSEQAIDSFRRFYSHYMKRFSVHYFTGDTIPGIDFALFLPIRLAGDTGKTAYYLMAFAGEDRRVMLYQKNLPTHFRTRANFFQMIRGWTDKKRPDENYQTDIKHLIEACEDPEILVAKRIKAIPSYLKKLQRRLHKEKLAYSFRGKWDKIQKFLEDRDTQFLLDISARIKSRHVDVECAKAAAETSKRNLHIYNWIMMGQSADIVRNRMQVTRVFPWLVEALATREDLFKEKRERDSYDYSSYSKRPIPDLSAKYAEIEKVIDKGGRLVEALSDFLSAVHVERPVSQSAVRKTIGLKLRSDLCVPETLAYLLREVDEHLSFMPLENGMLEILHDMQEGAARTFRVLNTSFSEVLSYAPESVRTNYLDTSQKADTIRDINNTADYVQQVYARLVLPYFALRAHQAGQELTLAMQSYLNGSVWDGSFERHDDAFEKLPPYLRAFGNMRFHNIVELSKDWHKGMGRYSARVWGVKMPNDTSWPALIPHTVTAPNGISITCLDSKNDLIEESKKMGQSCIQWYAAHCLGVVDVRGELPSYSHIFHLEAKGGDKATFEIKEAVGVSAEERRVVAGGIDGYRIRSGTWSIPPEESPLWRASRWLVEGVQTGKLKVHWDEIDRRRSQTNYNKIKEEAGFDPRQIGACEKDFEAFKPFLPERYRHYSYKRWVEKMGFEDEANILLTPDADLSLKGFNRLEYRGPN